MLFDIETYLNSLLDVSNKGLIYRKNTTITIKNIRIRKTKKN